MSPDRPLTTPTGADRPVRPVASPAGPDRTDPTSDPPSDSTSTRPDAIIRALAARFHGVVSRRQLVAAGVPDHVVDYRLRSGRLRTLHRGVYGVGPAPCRHERRAAAVLACGPTAALSHRTAAILWELLPAGADADLVDVTIRRGCRRPGAGVRVHRAPGLAPDETTRVEGIPLTTPARTLLDLAVTGRPRDIERALAFADRSGLASPGAVGALLSRHPGRPGTPVLRAVLDREGGPALTRSEAESIFLRLVRRAELPPPDANARVQGHEVDFLWRTRGLVVEIDGFAFHSSSEAFERDRRRDAELTAAGLRVVRVTWRQLTETPEALLVRLARALERGR